MSALTTLSDDLSEAVASAARSVVAVHGGRRMGASGVHWRPGVVVTTDHALEHDEDLAVTLPDGKKVAASLAGRDPSTDIAVLRIGESSCSVAEKTQADALRIGHVVLAVARHGDEGPAASMGVVSALSGVWTTWRGGRVDTFVRADLTLYPGFSGGPLVDVRGQTIGVNTSGLTRNWSVTLPATTVDRVTDALLSKGRIARGYLGVGLQSVRIPEALARALQLARGGGAIVVAVEPASPADRAGVMIGDVLVGLDGASVADVEDIHGLLGPEKVGSRALLRILRAGGLTEVSITVGERADADED
jgi:S1-C subfamily serine protease